jgi:hypothetical protein
MHTKNFLNIPIDKTPINKVNNTLHVPIEVTKKNNVVRHFMKPLRTPIVDPYIHTDSNGKKFIVLEGTTLNNVL